MCTRKGLQRYHERTRRRNEESFYKRQRRRGGYRCSYDTARNCYLPRCPLFVRICLQEASLLDKCQRREKVFLLRYVLFLLLLSINAPPNVQSNSRSRFAFLWNLKLTALDDCGFRFSGPALACAVLHSPGLPPSYTRIGVCVPHKTQRTEWEHYFNLRFSPHTIIFWDLARRIMLPPLEIRTMDKGTSKTGNRIMRKVTVRLNILNYVRAYLRSQRESPSLMYMLLR